MGGRMKRDRLLKSSRRSIALAAGVLGLSVGVAGAALANPPSSPGQPGAPTNTCGPDNPATPGGAVTAKGSPFNGSGQAGVVYAGNPGTASLANANSTKAVSQYDVACVQLSAT